MTNRQPRNPNRPNGRPSPGSDPFSAGDTISIQQIFQLLKIIKERLIWGIIAGTIFASIWLFVSLRKEKLYSAEAFLLIEPQAEQQIIDVEKVVDTSLTGWADSELENHLRKIKSRRFLATIVNSFGQAEEDLILAPYSNENEPPNLASVVNGSITIFREDMLFTILARHRDPRAAALIANRYLTRYINDTMDRTWTGNEAARAFLEERSNELKQKIADAEKQLTDYRAEHNLVSLEETQNLIVVRLNAINTQRTSTRIEQLSMDAALTQVEEMLAIGGDLTEISYIASYGTIGELLLNRKRLETEIAALGLRYLERHPMMIETNERLELTNSQLDAEIDRAVRDLRNRKASIDLSMERLAAELKSAEDEALALDRKAVEYNVLRRELESDRRTFDAIIARINETSLSGKLDTTNLRILDEAGVPSVPFSPNVKKNVMAGGILFLVGLLGVPFLIEALDNRLRTLQDVESYIGKPVLSELPFLKQFADGKTNPVEALNETSGFLEERFRIAYFSLNQHSRVKNPKTIMVTSTLPGEGKSFVSANMVACMANHGLRCLLVDTDFRRPMLHKFFEMRNDRGILQWLKSVEENPAILNAPQGQQIAPDDPHLEITKISAGFHLLRSGGSSKKATELVESAAFDILLTELKSRYDVIVLDTPPISVFTDANFIADLSDEIIYVARFKKVNREKARHFIRMLDLKHNKIVGMIVNGRTSKRDPYYNYSEAYKYYKDEDPSSEVTPSTTRRQPSRRSVTAPPFPMDDPS
ncbi:MAG: GumC family protein [Puniceicoccaceae bacterium]